MSYQTRQQMIRNTMRALTDQILLAIQQRLVHGRSVFVDLSSEPVLYRFADTETPEPTSITSANLTSHRSFRKLMTFAQLLCPPVQETMQSMRLLNRSGAAVTAQAVSACRLAGRLMEQLGFRDPAILDDRCQLPDLKALEQASPDLRPQNGRLINACVAATVEAVQARVAVWAAKQNGPVALLRFSGRGASARIEALTQAGHVVITLPLRGFVMSLILPAVERLADEMHHSLPAWERQHDEGMDILAKVCPGVADAVESAARESRPVGTRLCTVQTRRALPLEVWILVTPNPVVPDQGCVLAVNRPHRDFVLGAANRGHYYFPPCLLSARFSFPDLLPHADYPIVRQPAGGYNWCHPYTGKLSPGLLGNAMMLQREDEILYAPSEQAVVLFPQLKNRAQTAMENNLCLPGQEGTMHSAQEQLQSALASSEKADVLGAVTALHDVARLGLTRGHQNNSSGPRARLDSTSMPYPLQGRRLRGTLADRTFEFAVPQTTPLGPDIPAADARHPRQAELEAFIREFLQRRQRGRVRERS